MPTFSVVRHLGAWLLLCSVVDANGASAACAPPTEHREASSAAIEAFVEGRKMAVLTFAGYSGALYENPAAMLEHAARVLDAHTPQRTLVNIGATAEGIGAVYELAKARGFTTMGIVSVLARNENVPLSPCVDHVFFVSDTTWGGLMPGSTTKLSPTSAAIVAHSSSFVGIGGGDVARDELAAARRAGKPVTFIPADMSHQVARDKAKQRGAPEPTDFRGTAAMDAP